MAWRRASFASFADLRSSAVMLCLVLGAEASADSSVHCGQRLAKPGLSGFNSNSSLQTTQTLMGKGISGSMTILVMAAVGYKMPVAGRYLEMTKVLRRLPPS